MITINNRYFDQGVERFSLLSFRTRPRQLLSYDDILKIWNANNADPVIGTPSIDYENDWQGKDGILLPGMSVRVAVKSGQTRTRFNLEWDCSRD